MRIFGGSWEMKVAVTFTVVTLLLALANSLEDAPRFTFDMTCNAGELVEMEQNGCYQKFIGWQVDTSLSNKPLDVPFKTPIKVDTMYILTLMDSNVKYMPLVKVNGTILKMEGFDIFNVNQTVLSADFFGCGGRHLVFLSIVEGSLQALDRKVLMRLKHLKFLILSGNKIRDIPSKTFAGMTGLMYLDLSRNVELIKIYPRWFKDLVRLQVLRMEDCGILTLPEGILDPLHNLKIVDLANNHLQVITSSLFAKNTKLQRIYLEGNNIKEIEVNAFANIWKLRIVDLMNNDCIDFILDQQKEIIYIEKILEPCH